MKRYVGFISLLLLSIAQVAWSPFMMISGQIFPLFIVSVWVAYPHFVHLHLLVMTLVGGMILDSMGSELFGLHMFASVISLGAIHLIETYAITQRIVARVVSLLVAIILYSIIAQGGFTLWV